MRVSAIVLIMTVTIAMVTSMVMAMMTMMTMLMMIDNVAARDLGGNGVDDESDDDA